MGHHRDAALGQEADGLGHVLAAFELDRRRAGFGDQAGGILRDSIAAVSAGIVEGEPMLDLNYHEDSRAEVDFNVVRLGSGGLVEVQGTGEGGVFSRPQLQSLLDLAEKGIDELKRLQSQVLGAS